MSRQEYLGERESLRVQRKAIMAEVQSHRDSLLSALSILREPEELDGEYIAVLGVKLSERLLELNGVDKKIVVLNRELGD